MNRRVDSRCSGYIITDDLQIITSNQGLRGANHIIADVYPAPLG
jgi:hypothetical protein